MKRTPEGSDIRITPELAVEVTVRPDSAKRIRHGWVAAATSGIEVNNESSADAVSGEVSGAGHINLARATGNGTLWLRPPGRSVRVFEIDHPVALLDASMLIAADDTVTTTLGEKLDRSVGIATTARRAWVLDGHGACAIGSQGPAQLVALSENQSLTVEAGSLIAYSATISFTEASEYRKQVASRSLRKLAGAGLDKLGVPVDIDGSRQRIWVIAEGHGVVVLQNVVD